MISPGWVPALAMNLRILAMNLKAKYLDIEIREAS
jgi:hypothetical protein